MKNFLFLAIFIIALTTALNLMSYTPPTSTEPKTYTEMFDSVFSVVSKAQATTGILYERVVPFANLVNYNFSKI